MDRSAALQDETAEQQHRTLALRHAILCGVAALLFALVGWWTFSRYFSPAPIPVEAPREAMQPR